MSGVGNLLREPSFHLQTNIRTERGFGADRTFVRELSISATLVFELTGDEASPRRQCVIYYGLLGLLP